MTNLDFCIARRKAERGAFLRVLGAVPEGKPDYRPHPRSRTAAQLAWTIACEEADLKALLDKGVVDWKEVAPPPTAAEIVAAYEHNAAAVDERLGRTDEVGWQKKGQFRMNGAPAWETTIGEFVWGFLFDSIHHRGQLSTYLRPMGGKVPSIYGPSADDPGK